MEPCRCVTLFLCTMQRIIKNIIFDWGNVLIDVSMERFGKICNKYGIKFADSEVNSTHKASFFLEYEKGNIPDCEFRDEIRSRTTQILSDKEIDFIWNSMLGEIPIEKLQLLHTLKNRYKLYLLSNTNPIHWNTFSKKCFKYKGLKADDFFDGIYLSYKLHTAKPEAFIFQKLIEETSINVKESLFIDDSFTNCLTAQQLGMKTLNYAPSDNLANCVLKELEQN